MAAAMMWSRHWLRAIVAPSGTWQLASRVRRARCVVTEPCVRPVFAFRAFVVVRRGRGGKTGTATRHALV